MARGRWLGIAITTVAAAVTIAGVALAGPPTDVRQVRDLTLGAGDSFPGGFTPVGDTVFFTAADGTNGTELWKTDGTTAGTIMVKDVNPGGASSNPNDLTAAGGRLFFIATTVAAGTELWTSDGTAAGTVMVKDVNPGNGNGANPATTRAVGDIVFFRGNEGTDGFELWKSDGTAAGTVQVRDINPAPGVGAEIGSGGAFGDIYLFSANDGTNGRELWRSDGTTAGTVQVKDINATAPGAASEPIVSINEAGQLRTLGGFTYFRADDGLAGEELWRTDGSAAGTALVKDIQPGPGGSSVSPADVLGDQLILTANTSAAGRELWKSDGTAAGTVMVRDIDPVGSSDPAIPRTIGSHVLFAASDGVDGIELWRSDGTSAGTTQVLDVNPGPTGMVPTTVQYRSALSGGTLIFSASNGTDGIELWRSDGTAAGTSQLEDINAGAGDSLPNEMRAHGSTIYFSATDGVNGREPWKAADITAPDTTILSGPVEGQSMREPAPTFAFSSDDPPATFECALHRPPVPAEFSACSGPEAVHTPVADLADGKWVFEVRSIDAGGNVDPTPAKRSFTVDTGVKGAGLKVAKKQRQNGKKVRVKAKVKSKEPVTAVARGKVKIKGQKKQIKLKPAKKELRRGDKATLKLSPKKKKLARKVLKAVRAGKRVTAKLKVEFRDEAGNRLVRKAKTKLV